MDCQMPEMDGFAATEEIRRRERALVKGSQPIRRVTIVAMTANAFEEDRRRCLSVGMDDFLLKPIQLDVLAAALERWDAPLDAFVLKNLAELTHDKKQNFLKRLMVQYENDGKMHINVMKEALPQRDLETLKREAHALKGISGNMGATRMQELCVHMEALTKAETLDKSHQIVEAMKEELVRIKLAFATY